MPVSRESQISAKRVCPEESLHKAHRVTVLSIGNKAALPFHAYVKLEHIPHLDFHFVSSAAVLKYLKISAGLQGWHAVT